MAKDKNRHGMAAVEESTAEQAGDGAVAEQATTEATPAPVAAGPNFVIVYRRDHPGNRCSYGISGTSGIVVFDKGLFKDGVAPPSITLDCEMAQPKVDNKTAKAEAAAAKLVERAAKAQQKIEAAAAKAAERQAKADAALAAAKAKVEAAAAAKAATPAAPAVSA